LPEDYSSLPLYDYGDALVFPGMVDLHVLLSLQVFEEKIKISGKLL
jgi:cytosine/adenosine deaminase-related metal-dependent hydrolase